MAVEVWRHALSGFCFAKPCRVTDASLISQMKALEDENRRLKRMYADLSMQADLLKEALGKMYGPPRYCKVFVRGRPACVNVSGL